MKHIKNFKVFESNDVESNDVGSMASDRSIRLAIKNNDFETFKNEMDILFKNRDHDLLNLSDFQGSFERIMGRFLRFIVEFGRVDMLKYLLRNYKPSESDINSLDGERGWITHSGRKDVDMDGRSECLRLLGR